MKRVFLRFLSDDFFFRVNQLSSKDFSKMSLPEKTEYKKLVRIKASNFN
jgi:hypothetical protein